MSPLTLRERAFIAAALAVALVPYLIGWATIIGWVIG